MSSTYGADMNVCTRLPFTETVTRSRTPLRVATTLAAAARARATFAPTVSAMTGGVESRVTITCALPWRSALSTAEAMIALSPSANGTVAVKFRGP